MGWWTTGLPWPKISYSAVKFTALLFFVPNYVSPSKTCRLVSMLPERRPSRMRRVLLISLGITIRPRSSTLLTIPVAFIYLSSFPRRSQRLPLSGELSTEQADWGVVFLSPSQLRWQPPRKPGAFSRLQSFYKLRCDYLYNGKIFRHLCSVCYISPGCSTRHLLITTVMIK